MYFYGNCLFNFNKLGSSTIAITIGTEKLKQVQLDKKTKNHFFSEAA
jgi:hypothetical protein